MIAAGTASRSKNQGPWSDRNITLSMWGDLDLEAVGIFGDAPSWECFPLIWRALGDAR